MLIFHSIKASGSTFSRLHHRLLKSFKEAAISTRFRKINIRGKSIFRTFRNNIANTSANLTINSDVDKTHRYLICMKDPQLINASSLRTYKSRYKKEIKQSLGLYSK